MASIFKLVEDTPKPKIALTEKARPVVEAVVMPQLLKSLKNVPESILKAMS